MDEDLLRNEIYQRLGLEIGSLSSESGNDWERAKVEILDEFKHIEFKLNSSVAEIDYLSISKEKEEFKYILESNSFTIQDYKVLIAQRTDLTEDDIFKLIAYGNKEVIINLVKYQTLSSGVIANIIPNSVYLTKKFLIKKQILSDDQKKILLNQMSKHPSTYRDLCEQLKC